MFARLPLYDKDGFQIPGYLEIDVYRFKMQFSDNFAANPTVRVVQPDAEDN